MNQETIDKGKTAAIIAYILLVGPLIALSINSDDKNEYASFHIRNGLGLTLTFITLGLTISHFENIMIAGSLWVFITVLMFYGIFSAAKGSVRNLPLLGGLFQKWFSKM